MGVSSPLRWTAYFSKVGFDHYQERDEGLRASNSNLEDKRESMSNLESVRALYEAFARGDVPSEKSDRSSAL